MLAWTLLIGFVGIARGIIYQESQVGDPALVSYDMKVAGEESECAPLFAEGDLLSINASLYFIGGIESLSTYASDMFLVVKELNETTGEFIQCIQYGGWGDFVYPECVVVGKWPSSWSKHATGWYYYLADVSSAGFSGSSWEICVGNGYKGSYEESYTGSLFFTGSMITTGIPPTSMPSSMPSFVPTISFQPTSIPSGVPSAVPTQTIIPSRAPSLMPSTSVAPTATHWTIQSKCLDTVYLSYDLSLAGKEYECIIVPAKGLATSINISLYFSGSSGLEWPYDMAFALKSPTGPGIQVGGFEYYLPNISYAGPWPFEWRSPLDGWYYANVSIGKYGVEGSGDYTVCMVNAWVEATEVSYQGQVALDGLDYDCTPSPSPAPTSSPSSLPWILDGECGENTQLSYDLQLAGFESSCYSLDAAGFIQYLDIVLHFSGSVNGEWPSDMSLSVKFEDGIGFRIGGFDDEDPDLVYLGSWPPSWRNTSDGTYQAFVNISSALIVDSGEVEICITNGWEYAHMVHYDGHLELLGLIRTCDKKKSNNNDDDGNQTALALGLSIPLVLLAVALGGYFVISYYRKSEQRKKDALITSSQLSGDIVSPIPPKQLPVQSSSAYVPPQTITGKTVSGTFRSDSESGL